MDNQDTQIAMPVAKAAAALGAGAGSSAVAAASNGGSFLPVDLAGWMALAASTAAVLYTMHLLAEWYWKKVVRDVLVRWGWLPTTRARKQ